MSDAGLERPEHQPVRGSAPASADFFIRQAVEDFRAANSEVKPFIERAGLALGFVERTRLETGLDADGTPSTAEELPPMTLLDVIEWQAKQRLLNHYFGHDGGELSATPEYFEARTQVLAAREAVYGDIGAHEWLYGNSGEAYDSLLNSFFNARLLLNNPEGLIAMDASSDKPFLGRMLNVHNILKSLQASGFSKARHPSASSTEYGRRVDIVIDRGKLEDVFLATQPGSLKSERMSFEHITDATILVNAKLYPDEAKPFGLHLGDAVNLRRAVEHTIRRMDDSPAIAGIALQPEVGKVESEAA